MGQEFFLLVEIGRGEPRIGDVGDFGDGHGFSPNATLSEGRLAIHRELA
jgi:hypothetical protein